MTLARPAVLRVKVTAARVPSLLVKGAGRETRGSARGERPARLHIIPQRWWPDLITAAIPEGRDSVEFWGLGGPLRKGLIAASGADQHAPLWVVGRYDLDELTETVISRGAKGIASRFDLPEAAGIQPWPARMRQPPALLRRDVTDRNVLASRRRRPAAVVDRASPSSTNPPPF